MTVRHWRHLRFKLPANTIAMLARLRGCETRGLPFPRNYQANTGNGYSGAYQYTPSTGRRAGFTVAVYLASPAEQDVRTARFYPAHRSEWACRA